jgi:hypothetical protein
MEMAVYCVVLVAFTAFIASLLASGASASPALVSGALGASAWALETFIDLTESDGSVVVVELRRPCGASAPSIAHAFW